MAPRAGLVTAAMVGLALAGCGKPTPANTTNAA